MSGRSTIDRRLEYPRYFHIGGIWINSYKFFLCVGIYVGVLLSAWVASRSGLSPLAVGAGCFLFALVALVAARIYHVAASFELYRGDGFWSTVWNPRTGGWSIFGALVIFPLSLMLHSVFGIPVPVFWDHMAVGIAAGGGIIRFGCVWNGCCPGRETNGWFALRQHDVRYIVKRRIPVEWLEIAWWLVAALALIWVWPLRWPAGCYAYAVLAWYGLGRTWLEPLRESPELVWGRVRINQVVAGLLALLAGIGFVLTLQ
jgi:prolipoprotein diacylglyceryltransferase